ncbi:hypothetical protein EMA8858_01105 [Emticicia aquatica]|uniref:Uncharacterized protein n=1 Tax=Emticicia aquatica TaxID=1681835 RepID=A0ABM9AME8_9BACT|nr:hypothetical protein EMA8858_01105 [Emticicia aquatica]
MLNFLKNSIEKLILMDKINNSVCLKCFIKVYTLTSKSFTAFILTEFIIFLYYE